MGRRKVCKMRQEKKGREGLSPEKTEETYNTK